MNTFESCDAINKLLIAGKESDARNELIKLLSTLEGGDYRPYEGLINRLIRDVGLYPYIQVSGAAWQERFVFDAFKVDVGDPESKPLHREQSRLLHKLLSGVSVAVSAPTSFGKSFVIDAFIAIASPRTVMLIVPTIALADETRRRLQKKFGNQYKIITTSEDSMAEKNILILPQERAISYVGRLTDIDILIVDEFYKASQVFDKERAPALVRAIVELSQAAKQRYYLAPNITGLGSSQLTEGMEFIPIDFNTVFLEKHDLYLTTHGEPKKKAALLKILRDFDGKSLIYAGSHSKVITVANLLLSEVPSRESAVLDDCGDWLADNYSSEWMLAKLVRKGVGIHNGQLHRSLSQIQIRLFESDDGLQQLISTSSIIEGVNTSAKNVILWSNKKGSANLDSFTFKNIIGRAGRMFKHFVGRIFVLEKPPADTGSQLDLVYPDELIGIVHDDVMQMDYSSEQLAKKHAYESEMKGLVGEGGVEMLQRSDLNTSNTEVILRIARDIRNNPVAWNGLGHLNSANPEVWSRLLMRVVVLDPGAWGVTYTAYVAFVRALANNWIRTVPELLQDLSVHKIGLDKFFELERNTTYKLSGLLGDVQTIFNRINKGAQVELAPAISRLAHAFLPKVVYQLEEYGLPRMLSRKLCQGNVIDLETIQDVHVATARLQSIGLHGIVKSGVDIHPFEIYILRNFFEGISPGAVDRRPSEETLQ